MRWRALVLGVVVIGLVACDEHRTPTPSSAVEELTTADELQEERRYDEAEQIYARVLESPSMEDDAALHWRALYGWSRVKLSLGAHDDAKSKLDELADLAAGDPERESKTAHFGAAVMHREGNLDAAESLAKRSFDWAQQGGDWRLEYNAQAMLATVYSLSGRHGEALRIDEALLAQLREIAPGTIELALQMNEIGIDYRHFGRFEDAIRIFEESLELYREHEDIEGQAMVLYNLAQVHTQLGDLDRALELKHDSLEHAELVGHTYGLGLLNTEIGEIYLDVGNLELAQQHVERALEINRSARQAYGEIAALQLLARVELKSGHHDRAGEVLHESLQLAEEKGYGEKVLTALIALSRLAADLGNAEEALGFAERAVEQAMASRDPESEVDALQARARALELAGRIEEAVAIDLDVIALLESWRGRLALGDLRMGVARPRWEVFESGVRGLFALGRLEEAFTVSERAKARLLLELMAEPEITTASPTKEGRLRAELREQYALSESATAEQQAEIENRIDELSRELVELQSLVREATPSLAAARYPAPLSLDEVKARLVGPGRGLLTYLWGERDVYGWWIGVDGVRGRRLGTVEELRALVDFLRLTIVAPGASADWRPAARRGYRELVEPLIDENVQEIRIVADGPMTVIPFEVMLPGDNRAPLGLTYSISYGPSASVLAALTEREVESPSPRLLALAYSPEAWTAAPERTSVQRGADRLGPIPGAEAEARFIVDLFRDRGARLLTGDDGSFAAWIGAAPEEYRWLHFAVHARTSDRSSRESYMLLADGKLSTSRIRALSLRAELVTLAGCETALGYRVRGEGVIGLVHAFLAAGARSTLVSLWQIEDRFTTVLMEEFYRALHAGQRPPEALLQARRSLFESSQHSHPAFWASFVLVGSE